MAIANVPVIFDQQLLHKRRSRMASAIAVENFLQQRVGEDIIGRLELIKRDFSLATLFGDPACGFVSALMRLPNIDHLIYLRCTEELLPLANESVNLAISPLTLQHVNDLPGALVQLKRCLKPDGLFIAAFLGGDTLSELRDAMLSAEIDITGGAAARVHPRVDIRDLGHLLQRAGFALPVVDSDKLTVNYRSTTHLMHDLRALGLTNVLAQHTPTGLNRQILARLEEIYQYRYQAPDNRIQATFEIIYLTGWAPHHSQQKPLKPGSAKVRLADALNVPEIPLEDE